VDLEKVEVVLNWECLKTITNVRSVLGLSGYCCRFVE